MTNVDTCTIDSEREIRDINEWAFTVSKKFDGRFKYHILKSSVLDGNIVTCTYHVECDVPANDVTAVIHKQGLRYSRGRRYFFIYDRQRKFMFLLFYPYYQMNGAKQED